MISLDEISDSESQSDYEVDPELNPPHNDAGEEEKIPLGVKVDLLIGRMDKFIDCFSLMQKNTAKNQKRNEKKFKRLEEAHNVLITRVGGKSEATCSKLEELESRIKQNEIENKELKSRLSELEDKHDKVTEQQLKVNKTSSKQIKELIIEQGFTQKNMLDFGSEIKERKIILSGLYESANEDVRTTALTCINSVIEAAMANLLPNEDPTSLKVLESKDIDNVFRIGKVSRGNRKRNISITFVRMDDKDMVLRARARTKDNSEIKCYFADDLTVEGRAHKAQIKRISSADKSHGFESNVTGNKLIIDNKTYFSN